MERNVQGIGIVNWVTLLVIGALSAVLARFAGSWAGLAGVVFLAVGFLVAFVGYVQMRIEERERSEKLEFDELKKAKGGSTLFTEADETFPAKRAREQFERFLVPAFTVLLCALQGVAAWYFWARLGKAAPPSAEAAKFAMSLFALFALILFLLGKYSAGLARLDRQRLLRPGAGYMLLGSLVLTVVALTEASVYFGFPKADIYVAGAFCVVLALAAAESLISLVLEIYRPRLRGQAARLLYESRLIGLLGQPGGLIRTAAQALDYQFGFKVSETWFYRFLEKALSWIILGQLTALWLSSVLVIIEPNELALLERFGRPVESRPILRPGAHFKFPWPIDQVYRYKAQEIQSLVVGPTPDPEFEKERTVLWTRPHYREEFNLLVASRDPSTRTGVGGERAVPANLLIASIPVQYQITNLVQWAYRHSDAPRLLEGIAFREVSRFLVSVDIDQVMSYRRLEVAEAIRERIQQAANDKGLGVRIVLVGMQDIHPPVGNKQVAVAAAFEAVVGAIQQKQTNILDALAYEAQRLPAAQAEATNILASARSEAIGRVAVAEAEAGQFGNQIAAHRASPSVYTQRSFLETLGRATATVNKYYLGTTNTDNVIWLNLEQTIRGDLLNRLILPPDAGGAATPTR